MPARRKHAKPLKACTKCKCLVTHDVMKCPVCGNESFTENWSGMIVVIDPETSEVAKALNIRKPGRYAIRLGL